MSHRVMVAESYRLLRQGICALIDDQADFEVVAQASDGREALNKCSQLQPDIALIDLGLPGLPGVMVAQEILRRSPLTRIVVITAYDAREYILEAFKLGIHGFLLKDTSADELILALRNAAIRKRYLSPEISGHLLDAAPSAGPGVSGGRDGWNELTNRERIVFKLIAEGHTNRTAASYLSLSQKTVEKHRSSLMHKLKLHSPVELVLAAVEVGLIKKAEFAALRREPAVSAGRSFNPSIQESSFA